MSRPVAAPGPARAAQQTCFHENGISIAFVRPDVPLDTARPIPVRVVDGAGRRAGETP